MRKIATSIILCVAGLSIFIAGIVLSAKYNLLSPVVTFHITNASDLAIEELTIDYKYKSFDSRMTASNMPSKSSTTVRVMTAGEIGYSINGRFSDGTEIPTIADYATAGDIDIVID